MGILPQLWLLLGTPAGALLQDGLPTVRALAGRLPFDKRSGPWRNGSSAVSDPEGNDGGALAERFRSECVCRPSIASGIGGVGHRAQGRIERIVFVLTLGAYVSYVRHLGSKGSRGRYLAVAFLFAMGLMSKPPSLVTLPFVLLLLDYWPLNRFGQPVSADVRAKTIRWQDSFTVFKGLVIEKIPLFALSAASCAVTILTGTQILMPVEHHSIAARLGNAIASYMAYLGQTFYPANLAVFYPFPASSVASWKILSSLVLLASISVIVLRCGEATVIS